MPHRVQFFVHFFKLARVRAYVTHAARVRLESLLWRDGGGDGVSSVMGDCQAGNDARVGFSRSIRVDLMGAKIKNLSTKIVKYDLMRTNI